MIGSELIRPNQVVNRMWGLCSRGSEMEMKSRFVQLCVDASTRSMVDILRLGRIQVKGKLLEIVTEIHRKSRQNFRDQEQTSLRS